MWVVCAVCCHFIAAAGHSPFPSLFIYSAVYLTQISQGGKTLALKISD